MNKSIGIKLFDVPEARKAIRRRLKEIGMSQSDLAHKLGVSRPYINSIVAGKRHISTTRLNEICSSLRISNLPGIANALIPHLLAPYYGSKIPKEEVWLAIHRYVPYFDKKGIRAFDRYLDLGTRYTFWGGPSSDIRMLGLMIKDKKRKGQVNCVQGPSWLDCLSCKIYSPLSLDSHAEYITTRDLNYEGTKNMDNLVGQLICRNLLAPYLLLRSGEKVEGFGLV